jgi:hypothetical protein
MRDGFLAYLKEDAKRGKDDGKNDLANIAERKLASGAERHSSKVVRWASIRKSVLPCSERHCG